MDYKDEVTTIHSLFQPHFKLIFSNKCNMQEKNFMFLKKSIKNKKFKLTLRCNLFGTLLKQDLPKITKVYVR